jgi:7-keto-8-aminopelargonate synthetase-like enzyme
MSATEAVLTSLGLSQDCPLAIVVLDDCFAAAMTGDDSQGSAIHILDEEESVSVLSGTDSSSAKVHLFDNPNDRRLLWFTHGLGAWVIKKLNECRNNLSSYVWQSSVSACYCFSIS